MKEKMKVGKRCEDQIALAVFRPPGKPPSLIGRIRNAYQQIIFAFEVWWLAFRVERMIRRMKKQFPGVDPR